jgi:hypothetical protein
MVKNLFGQSFIFSFYIVYYKSDRQVLTPVDNLQCLLRQPIYDKTRLVALHLQFNKENYNNWFLPEREK